MVYSATQPTTTTAASAARSAGGISRVGGLRIAQGKGDEHSQLQKASETLVAQTFYGTLLKQIRNSPFKSDLMSGGKGGEAFGQLYDQHLAERMGAGPGRRLANSIVKRHERRKTDAAAARRA